MIKYTLYNVVGCQVLYSQYMEVACCVAVYIIWTVLCLLHSNYNT